MSKKTAKKKSPAKVRFVTATTLFDGHDASINVFRRLLQRAGALHPFLVTLAAGDNATAGF